MAHDVLGHALNDYLNGKLTDRLMLYTSYGTLEEMPVEEFFRSPDDLPELEYLALALCDGHVLDVGAGAGSHALYLQSKGVEVHALEISPMACNVMRQRGIRHVIEADFFQYSGRAYDTLLFLMNGIGIASNLDRLETLLAHSRSLLNPGGQLLFDSSDITYLYADGRLAKPAGYYGEISYRYTYKGLLGERFTWLFIDQETLIQVGRSAGWVVQILYEDEYGQYLARMELRDQ